MPHVKNQNPERPQTSSILPKMRRGEIEASRRDDGRATYIDRNQQQRHIKDRATEPEHNTYIERTTSKL